MALAQAEMEGQRGWAGTTGLGVPLGALIVSHIVWDNVIFLIAPTTKLEEGTQGKALSA